VNSTVLTTQIKSYLCPSDPNSTSIEVTGLATANNCYFGCIGDTTDTLQGNAVGAASLASVQYTGLFAWQQSKSVAHVLDGMSNTVAFAESTVGSASANWGQKLIGFNSASSIPSAAIQINALTNPAGVQSGIAACNAVATQGSGGNIDRQRGDSWAIGGMAMTLFNTVAPPNSSNGLWAYCGSNNSGTYANFSNSDSYHPGGANVLMADGHVQFIKNSVNLTTWWSLGTVAGGEVIDATSY
jgi:prepilin-type processing-associated H-X9-DG protein